MSRSVSLSLSAWFHAAYSRTARIAGLEKLAERHEEAQALYLCWLAQERAGMLDVGAR